MLAKLEFCTKSCVECDIMIVSVATRRPGRGPQAGGKDADLQLGRSALHIG